MASSATPLDGGLYDPSFEHDACGVGFVADLTGRVDHDIVAKGLTVLRNLEHRGAKGADPDTGDGAGILTQMPDEFFRSVLAFPLPPAGAYAAGLVFLPGRGPDDHASRDEAKAAIEAIAVRERLTVLGWREVPHDPAACGAAAAAVLPHLEQLFVAGEGGVTGADLDRRAFCLRKQSESLAGAYFVSLSSATIVYKGMLTPPQLEKFFPDLADPRYA
jgi:glutamate synthase (NADPH/NADH) large chain